MDTDAGRGVPAGSESPRSLERRRRARVLAPSALGRERHRHRARRRRGPMRSEARWPGGRGRQCARRGQSPPRAPRERCGS